MLRLQKSGYYTKKIISMANLILCCLYMHNVHLQVFLMYKQHLQLSINGRRVKYWTYGFWQPYNIHISLVATWLYPME